MSEACYDEMSRDSPVYNAGRKGGEGEADSNGQMDDGEQAVVYSGFHEPGARSEIGAPSGFFSKKKNQNGRPKIKLGYFQK